MPAPAASNPNLEALMQSALCAAQNSYSPYSGFKVGAALELENGAIVTGTNIENVSFSLTICAERAALARAIAEYGPNLRIRAVAVANLNNTASTPCGACRQTLGEFIEANAPVSFPADDGVRTMSFAELLPLAFQMKRQ